MAKKKNSTARAPQPVTEDDWRAESDARTLADAKVIMADKNRLKKATSAAKKMADCKMEEAKAMKAVARKAPKGK